MNRNWTKKIDLIFLALWVGILCVGIVLKISTKVFGWPPFDTKPLAENRLRSPRPDFGKLSVKEWGKGTDDWYNDNFPFRREVIDGYQRLHFQVLKSPLVDHVPGVGNWIFGRGGKWPEIEDYLGVTKMDEKMIEEWVTLFEGRVAYAEAHGSHYLELVAPLKSHVHPEKILPMIRTFRKESYREDLRKRLENSFAYSNIFFLAEVLQEEVKQGREVYYEEDHHENAYGCYVFFREMMGRIRTLWYPDVGDFPFYEKEIPQGVLERTEAGCYEKDRRLVVSNPAMKVADYAPFRISKELPNFPSCKIYMRQPGPERLLILCHDSYLRYPLSTWHDRQDATNRFALPIGSGFDAVCSLLWTRIRPEMLDGYYAGETPSVLVEQFSEGRLQYGPIGLDETMRRASAWGRGTPLGEDGGQTNSVLAMAVFEKLQSHPRKKPIQAKLLDEVGDVMAEVEVNPGVRRAVFFGEVPAGKKATIVLEKGESACTNLYFRYPPTPADARRQ